MSAALTSLAARENPLLTPSPLPFGYPQFDQIQAEDFEPAFAVAMDAVRAEVSAIADNPAAPTFANTLVALERSGQLLDSVNRNFSNLNGTDTNPTLSAVEARLSPLLAGLSDEIHHNGALFARIAAVHAELDALHLNTEDRRLVEQTYIEFVRRGAKLTAAEKTRVSAINLELASLETNFKQNVLAEVNAAAVLFATAGELDGLSAPALAAAAKAATRAGHAGSYLLALQNTSSQPVLASLTRRETRARIQAVSLARGSNGGPFDNRMVVARIARLRAERAQLLGYPTYAAYVLEERTAKTVAAVNGLLSQLARAAAANVQREVSDLQQAIAADGESFPLAPSDWSYYAGKVRAARYDYDEADLRPYLELNRVLQDGVFHAAQALYGLSFRPRPDLPVYHPTVQTWEVLDRDGSTLAFIVTDFYARSSKRGGAWMSSYAVQSRLLDTHAIVALHLNIDQPAAGEATLLTWSETKTLFHEFGHVLHGILSDVTYPRFSGTSVPRDFVEFPSQVNEMWRTWPEVLGHYAVHYQTGEPIPAALLAKIEAAATFNQGFMTTEYLAAALLDQAWHQLTPEQVPDSPEAVMAFEKAALDRAGLDLPAVPPRYRSPYFSHTFSGGYAAGYYSYIWSEVLDADSVEWFKAHGGLTRANGDHFRATLLSRGEAEDPMQLFRDFTGRDPSIRPLLERRGLASAGAPVE